jgi:hypothetical protein
VKRLLRYHGAFFAAVWPLALATLAIVIATISPMVRHALTS